jgi:hypothetical protein
MGCRAHVALIGLCAGGCKSERGQSRRVSPN